MTRGIRLLATAGLVARFLQCYMPLRTSPTGHSPILHQSSRRPGCKHTSGSASFPAANLRISSSRARTWLRQHQRRRHRFCGRAFRHRQQGGDHFFLHRRADPGKTLDEIHQRVFATCSGVKVVGETMRFWNSRILVLEHPEWQELELARAKSPRYWAISIWPGSAVDRLLELPVRRPLYRRHGRSPKRLDWDGYNLDGMGCWTLLLPRVHAPTSTIRAGKSPTGRQRAGSGGGHVVADYDLNDPEFRHYLKWRLDRYTHYVAKWQTRLKKEVKPDFAAMPWSTGPGRWWHWSFAPFA